MDEEINEEPLTIEEYKKLGEALKNAKKYLHIFMKLAHDADIDFSHLDHKYNDFIDVQADLHNLSYDI